MSPSERFMQIVEEMKDIHIRKNAGYGGKDDPWKNFRGAERLGSTALIGCLMRLEDKIARIESLIQCPQNDQVGESILDSLKDAANYCVIACCLYEEEQVDFSMQV